MLTRSPEFNPTEGTEAAPPKAISFTRTQAIRTFLEKVTDLPVKKPAGPPYVAAGCGCPMVSYCPALILVTIFGFSGTVCAPDEDVCGKFTTLPFDHEPATHKTARHRR